MKVASAYYFEVGILLEPEDSEFESYNMVYNKKWGYFNENWGVIKQIPKELEELKDYIKSYVADGKEHTYGIIEKLAYEIEYEEDEEYAWENGGGEICSIYDIQGSFKTQDVIWSIAKLDGKLTENFLK